MERFVYKIELPEDLIQIRMSNYISAEFLLKQLINYEDIDVIKSNVILSLENLKIKNEYKVTGAFLDIVKGNVILDCEKLNK